MGRRCLADLCPQRMVKQCGNITLFSFPTDRELREKWLHALLTLNKQENISNLPKCMYLCELHFEKNYIEKFGFEHKRLKRNSLPTIFRRESDIFPKEEPMELGFNNNHDLGTNLMGNPESQYQDSKAIKKRKSETIGATPPNERYRKKLLVSSDEILLEGDDDIPGQSTSTDRTLSKFEEIESQEEFIQRQSLKASVSPKKRRINSRILKRKILLNSKKQQNPSTDVNTSDVQAQKRPLRKNVVASSKRTQSKRPPVKPSHSKVSSINSPSTRVQNSEILKHKSSSNSNIQKNKNTDYMDDEFDIFAKDIAFQLRQLPYYNALQCQEKIKRVINQERFIAQQSRHQEIETIIVKKEPGLNEQGPVSSQGTIQTIIKDELVISEDEYPDPVSGQKTMINKKTAIREKQLSHQVSSQETIQTIIKEEPVISEDEYPHPISGQESMINKKSAIREKELSHQASGHETIQTIIYHMPTPLSSPLPDIKMENMISDTQSVTSSIESVLNQESGISEKELSHQVSSQETIQTTLHHIPPPLSSPLPVIKTENLSSDTESVTSSIESIDFK